MPAALRRSVDVSMKEMSVLWFKVYFKLYFNVPPGKSLMMEVDHYSIRSTQSSRIKSLFPLMPSVRDVLTLEPSSELMILTY